MSKLNSIDLTVKDVPAAAQFFQNVVGMTLGVSDERFAELSSNGFVVMLSPDALVPLDNAAGIILHFEVEDVAVALENAKTQGAKVLLEPTQTDWGTESAMIQGPEGIIVDFYRNL